jgi:hypothetical protein
MAVRRLHGGGAYTSMHQSDDKVLKALKWDIDFYKKMQTHLFKGAYNSLIESCIKDKEDVLSYYSDNRGSNTSVLSEIVSHVPANGSFILVDEWYLNAGGQVEGKNVLPFLEQDGVYWGRPADDEAAIAEIERQQKNGVNVMVFTWQAFWWLEHYCGMYNYLKENYRCILSNGCMIGFDLQKRNLKQAVVEVRNESTLHPTSI